MSGFQKDMQDFAEQYGYTIKSDAGFEPGDISDIHLSMFDAFEELGQIEYSEQGCSPEEFLPGIINAYLSQLDTSNWRINEIDSDDDWFTVTVELVNELGEKYQFDLPDVNDSDWVPASLASRMREFSKVKTSQTLMTFYSDDPYLIVAMKNDAAEKILELIKTYKEF